MLVCCSCKEDEEILTSAIRARLDKDPAYAMMSLHPTAQAPPSGVTISTPVMPHRKSEDQPLAPRNESRSSPTKVKGRTGALEVPEEFEKARLRQLMSAEAGSIDETARQESLKVCIRHFTRSLVKGICMSVLLDDGRTLLTDASLNSELTHLVLYVPNLQHPVALCCIESVCAPYEVMQGEMLNQALLDERCTTLIIRGGQFLTFVFDTARIREYFEVCLKVLILAREPAGEPLTGPEPTLVAPSALAIPQDANREMPVQTPEKLAKGYAPLDLSTPAPTNSSPPAIPTVSPATNTPSREPNSPTESANTPASNTTGRVPIAEPSDEANAVIDTI